MIQDDIWVRVDELFDAALDLPVEARSRWLSAVCAEEPELREQVEHLLTLAESDDPRLEPDPVAGELIRELVRRVTSHDILGECESESPPPSSEPRDPA